MKIIALYCILMIVTAQVSFAAEPELGIGAAKCGLGFEPANSSYQFVQEQSSKYNITGSAKIGEIHFTRLPIFDEIDPDENNALFRWANRMHILTHKDVISRQILFARGELYNDKLMEETGRLLRKQGYFYDVNVRPLGQCGDEVGIEVITKDNWSLTPNLSLDRSGGDNTYGFGIRDSNILGLGKQFEIASSKDAARRSQTLIYEDNNVLGSRVRTRGKFINSDDGSNQLFELSLPFFPGFKTVLGFITGTWRA